VPLCPTVVCKPDEADGSGRGVDSEELEITISGNCLGPMVVSDMKAAEGSLLPDRCCGQEPEW
jgi:hypothetical protein